MKLMEYLIFCIDRHIFPPYTAHTVNLMIDDGAFHEKNIFEALRYTSHAEVIKKIISYTKYGE